jgi:hypothetical protein
MAGLCELNIKPAPANHPPMTGPKIVVRALKVDQVPYALPRLSLGISAEILERLPGTIKALLSPVSPYRR